jgi:hypothetical protein
MERWIKSCRQGLLGVLFVMNNDAQAEHRWRSWFLVVFHMLQVGQARVSELLRHGPPNAPPHPTPWEVCAGQVAMRAA